MTMGILRPDPCEWCFPSIGANFKGKVNKRSLSDVLTQKGRSTGINSSKRAVSFAARSARVQPQLRP